MGRCRQVVYERSPGAATRPCGPYRRRQPENTVLHRIVRENLQTMLAEARDANGMGLPRYVEREFRAYLACGILAHGFVRISCDTCRKDMLVAFSCKGRGLCPSCSARRMADTAAHLVDRVIPQAPIRQWVLSFPKRIRLWLARDQKRVTKVHRLFVRAVFAWQRKKARVRAIPDAKPAAVTFVQRFGGLVNLNVHFHVLVPDGVFEPSGSDAHFFRLPGPRDDEVLAIVKKVARRVLRLVDDETVEEDDALSQAQTQAVETPIRPRDESVTAFRRVASVDGFSLHAGVRIAAHDRVGLERLCRYGARPAFAQERLALTANGNVSYRLKRPWPDGRTAIVLSPTAFLRKLAGIVPPPRAHLVRYSGAFAPNARLRPNVIALGRQANVSKPTRKIATRLPWAELLRRVFATDVLACHCGGRLRVIAFISEPTAVARILAALDLPNDFPHVAPARAPPQTRFDEHWAQPFADPIPPDDSYADPPGDVS